MTSFSHGQRVRLRPFEDQPEQTGVVIGIPHDETRVPYMVRLDREHCASRLDDGLREAMVDQLEDLPKEDDPRHVVPS